MKTDGIANAINGKVITQGDSCGFSPVAKP